MLTQYQINLITQLDANKVRRVLLGDEGRLCLHGDHNNVVLMFSGASGTINCDGRVEIDEADYGELFCKEHRDAPDPVAFEAQTLYDVTKSELEGGIREHPPALNNLKKIIEETGWASK